MEYESCNYIQLPAVYKRSVKRAGQHSDGDAMNAETSQSSWAKMTALVSFPLLCAYSYVCIAKSK